MSIEFKWNELDVEHLLSSCEEDTVLPYIKKYVKKEDRILESGCGLGRWVRYLHEFKYNVTGLELSQKAVDFIKKKWPDLKIQQGDAENSPFGDSSYEIVISLGVVEHWVEGPEAPLKDIYRVLSKGGIGIITVPCLNKIRKIKRNLFLKEIIKLPKAIVKYLINKNKINITRFNRNYKYVVSPAIGDFFEYQMSNKQFEDEIKKIGFKILEHKPIAEIDGIYHELNFLGLLIKFKKWKFYPTKLAKKLNALFSKQPFFHNHMQIIIVEK